MIVLDASVLIAHFAATDAHSSTAFELLDTEDDLAMHPITLAETLVLPARRSTEAHTRDRIEDLGVEQLVPPPEEPLALARLRAATGLRLPDCCVLAAAEREGAALATFDARLAQTARARGLTVLGA